MTFTVIDCRYRTVVPFGSKPLPPRPTASAAAATEGENERCPVPERLARAAMISADSRRIALHLLVGEACHFQMTCPLAVYRTFPVPFLRSILQRLGKYILNTATVGGNVATGRSEAARLCIFDPWKDGADEEEQPHQPAVVIAAAPPKSHKKSQSGRSKQHTASIAMSPATPVVVAPVMMAEAMQACDSNPLACGGGLFSSSRWADHVAPHAVSM